MSPVPDEGTKGSAGFGVSARHLGDELAIATARKGYEREGDHGGNGGDERE
jgi:hypothetical protein